MRRKLVPYVNWAVTFLRGTALATIIGAVTYATAQLVVHNTSLPLIVGMFIGIPASLFVLYLAVGRGGRTQVAYSIKYRVELINGRGTYTIDNVQYQLHRCKVVSFQTYALRNTQFYVVIEMEEMGLGLTGEYTFAHAVDYMTLVLLTQLCRRVATDKKPNLSSPIEVVDCFLDPNGKAVGVGNPALHHLYLRP